MKRQTPNLVEFSFPVVRGEEEVILEVTCEVTPRIPASYWEAGESEDVQILSALDAEGIDVDLSSLEEDEIAEKAIDVAFS